MYVISRNTISFSKQKLVLNGNIQHGAYFIDLIEKMQISSIILSVVW